MGEDSKDFEGQLYFQDGTSWQPVEICEQIADYCCNDVIVTETAFKNRYFEPDPCYEPTGIAMLPDYFSFVVQTPHFRTNKCFKKFLMGIGVSRNLADFMCKMIAKGKGKYQLCYTGYMLAVIDNLSKEEN